MYEWLKVVHILAVISWMAGLLYLPRLMVYHAGKTVGSDGDLTFQTMERRLLKAIMRPAALVAVVTGFGLWHLLGLGFSDVWFDLKLLGVAGLVVSHGLLEVHVRRFARGENARGSRYFRILNEVPTAFMVLVVIMVVVKPFA
jgi:protoporphyrinogen IX oxidase